MDSVVEKLRTAPATKIIISFFHAKDQLLIASIKQMFQQSTCLLILPTQA
uniref:Uncharacterized protein n=1 Tax=Brassica campestris TaxID=3711 RepID=A0A3P5ZUM7_BRACM|nr:unnamed protein product [Brassica rapa]